MPENTAEIFNRYRWLLFSIAYRMLSSATDAEDIVQETYVRWLNADQEEVRSPKAFLTAVATRLCIDQLRSARRQRELYVEPWLPEPLPTGRQPQLLDTAILAESLSFAFLTMLETLNPLERAIFLLREVFDYRYSEIAGLVGKSEANCRQILRRARQRLGNRRSRFEVAEGQSERIAKQFLNATRTGNMQGLLELLTDDVVFVADSGGKVKTSLKPVEGKEKVARGLLGGLRQLPPESRMVIEEINGQPALVGYVGRRALGVMHLDLEGDRVRAVYTIVNPDKLHWIDKHWDKSNPFLEGAAGSEG